MTKQSTNQVAVTRKWDDYVKEASKPDFIIERGDEPDIVIHTPTGEQSLKARRLGMEGELEDMIRVLCGEDAAKEILPMILAAPAGAMNAFAKDVTEHFIGDEDDQGNSPASST